MKTICPYPKCHLSRGFASKWPCGHFFLLLIKIIIIIIYTYIQKSHTNYFFFGFSGFGHLAIFRAKMSSLSRTQRISSGSSRPPSATTWHQRVGSTRSTSSVRFVRSKLCPDPSPLTHPRVRGFAPRTKQARAIIE